MSAYEAKIQEILEGIDINLKESYNADMKTDFSTYSSDIANELSHRTDLRDLLTFSVDPKGCTDIDDAISCSLNENGNYVVHVHIADPSFFVQQGSPIDLTAKERASSLYLPSGVIPMLPEILSNDICSLLPHKDRLAITSTFTFNNNGALRNFTVERSVIRSSAKLTYEDAQYILDNEESDEFTKIIQPLQSLNFLAKQLKEQRTDDTILNTPSIDTRYIYEDGKMVDIRNENRSNSEAHNLIAEFMILTNSSIAEYLSEHNRSGIILFTQVMDSQDDLEKLQILCKKNTGIRVNFSSNKKFQTDYEFLKKKKGPKVAQGFIQLMRKAMPRGKSFSLKNLKKQRVIIRCTRNSIVTFHLQLGDILI